MMTAVLCLVAIMLLPTALMVLWAFAPLLMAGGGLLALLLLAAATTPDTRLLAWAAIVFLLGCGWQYVREDE